MIISSLIAASTKASKFMSDDDEFHQKTDDDSHQYDYRLMDGWLQKNQASMTYNYVDDSVDEINRRGLHLTFITKVPII